MNIRILLSLIISLGSANLVLANNNASHANLRSLTEIKDSLVHNLHIKNVKSDYIGQAEDIVKELDQLIKDAIKHPKILVGEYITTVIALAKKAQTLYYIRN